MHEYYIQMYMLLKILSFDKHTSPIVFFAVSTKGSGIWIILTLLLCCPAKSYIKVMQYSRSPDLYRCHYAIGVLYL